MSTRIAAALNFDKPSTPIPMTPGQKAAQTRRDRQAAAGTVAHGTVSPIATKRIDDDVKALVASGYDVEGAGKLLYASGRRVIAGGDERLTSGRIAWEQLPPARDELARFAGAVRSEKRVNLMGVPLGSILSTLDGAVSLEVGGKATMYQPTTRAIGQVGSYIAPGLGQYLPIAPHAARSAIFNAHAEKIAGTKISMGVRDSLHGKPFVVPQLFRVASDSYLPIDPDMVADAMAAALPKSWRAEIRYDGDSWMIEATTHADTVVDLATGDMFKAGLRFKSNDVVQGGASLSGFARRILCQNLIIVGDAVRPYFRKIHIGAKTTAVNELAAKITESVSRVEADLSRFTKRWDEARHDRIIDESASKGPESVFGALVDAGLVDLPGGRDRVVANLVVAWNAEPGYSRADVVNAITRAAHEAGSWWNDLTTQEDAEVQASKLLYVKNLVTRIDTAIAARATSAIEFN